MEVVKIPRKMAYAEMRAAGLCTICGKTNPTPDHGICPSCRDQQNKARRENKAYLKSIGVCVRCGRNKAEPHKVLCYECAGAESDAYFQNGGKTENQKEKDKNRKRLLAHQRLESGMCPRCGKYLAMNGGTCKKCRAYGKRYRDSHRDSLPRSEWRDYGVCYICGKNEVIPGKGVCQNCYETRLKTIPAMLANQNPEYFRHLNNLVFRRQ